MHTRTLRVLLYPLRSLQYVKYTATITYGNWPNRIFGFFCSSSSSSVKLAYCQSATSTRDGFYPKRLLSVACIILEQENLRNFTQNCIIENFTYFIFCMFTCVPRFYFIERWGSSERVRGSRRGWGSCEPKQVYRHSTKKQK